jgi:F-type H+-transporting ATPase subunit epsilon
VNLKVLLPSRIFIEEMEVKEIVAQTPQGSFGLLPNRLDCAAALAPGILTYQTKFGNHVDLAIDQGVLVKAGTEVLVSVRDAIGGLPLGQLHEAVLHQFVELNAEEQSIRSTLIKMEDGFIHRLIKFQNE